VVRERLRLRFGAARPDGERRERGARDALRAHLQAPAPVASSAPKRRRSSAGLSWMRFARKAWIAARSAAPAGGAHVAFTIARTRAAALAPPPPPAPAPPGKRRGRAPTAAPRSPGATAGKITGATSIARGDVSRKSRNSARVTGAPSVLGSSSTFTR